jgi:hypothetical protein
MGEPGYTPAHKGVSFRFTSMNRLITWLISRRPNGLVAVPFRRKPSHCWPVRVLLPSSTACVHAALSSEQRDQRAS